MKKSQEKATIAKLMRVLCVCWAPFSRLAPFFCRNRTETSRLGGSSAARSGSERCGRRRSVCGLARLLAAPGVPEMVGHLHLQAMDDSLKGKNREGLLDSPDSGLPPSPSPPFCALSPGLLEPRSGSCSTPVESHHGFDRKESREGKLVSASGSRLQIGPVRFTLCCPKYRRGKSDG